MDLGKYIGTIPEGDHIARVTDVEFGTSKKNTPQFIFTVHFQDLDVSGKVFYPETNDMLWKLTRDLGAAEVLRDGDAYSDDLSSMAREIKEDLSDRAIVYSVTKNGQYTNYEVTGVSFA